MPAGTWKMPFASMEMIPEKCQPFNLFVFDELAYREIYSGRNKSFYLHNVDSFDSALFFIALLL